mgnify:FL=1
MKSWRMDYIGLEFGSLYFILHYKDSNNNIQSLPFGSSDSLFAAYSYDTVNGFSYGKDTIRSIFIDPFSVFTNFALLYPRLFDQRELSSLEFESPKPLKRVGNSYCYDNPASSRGYTTIGEAITIMLRQILACYHNVCNGVKRRVGAVITVPDPFFNSGFLEKKEGLVALCKNAGFREVVLIPERDAIMKVNEISFKRTNYVILCCGEAYNSYTVVSGRNIVMQYPTPNHTGRIISIQIANEIIDNRLPPDVKSYVNAMSSEQRKVFTKEILFCTRVALVEIMGTQQPLSVHLVAGREFNVEISKKDMQPLIDQYLQTLLNHAHPLIEGTLPSDDYSIFVCGDFASLTNMKEFVSRVFRVNENRVVIMAPSSFAEGALLSTDRMSQEVHYREEINPLVMRSLYPD